MRISTNTIFDLGVMGIQQQTSALSKTQQQIAAQRRILTPADDPVAAARVLEVSQSKAINQQYDVNTNSAASALGLEDATLTSVENLIQSVHDDAIAAGAPSLDSASLKGLATGLRANYQQLLGLANTKDANGQYMFSGYKGSTQPFSETAPGNVAYNGDQGQRLMQISQSHQIAVSDAGSDVFMQIKNGNGTFVTAAAAGNTGTGLISGGSATTTYDGNSYQIKFTSATTYDVLDAAGNPLAPPVSATYTSGSDITVGNGHFSITGTPAINDTFTVKPSTNESLFTTIDNLIKSLDAAALPGSSATALTNSQQTAIKNLGNALNQVLTVHATVGLRMNDNDAVKSTGQDIALQYDQTLSSLQDLDMAQASIDLNKQLLGLQAAQQSFVKIQGLSLFNYIQ